jgi:hypothetical protein
MKHGTISEIHPKITEKPEKIVKKKSQDRGINKPKAQ